jgi:type I restriction enzyme S subunit
MAFVDCVPHPQDWRTATISKCVEIRRGLSWSKEQEHSEAKDYTVPVLRIGNVQQTLQIDDLLHIADVPKRAIEAKAVSKDWTLLVGSNGNRDRIGNCVFVEQDSEFLFASFLLGAKPRPGTNITPQWFCRWLGSPWIQAKLTSSAQGTTGLSNLSHDYFRRLVIAYPPADEQAAIVAILNSADAAISRLCDLEKQFEYLGRGLLQRTLRFGCGAVADPQSTRFGSIPSHWSCVQLGALIAEGPTNGIYRPLSDYGESGVQILRIDDFDSGNMVLSSQLRRLMIGVADQQRYALKDGDIVINRVNSLSHIGKSMMVSGVNEPTVFESNMMRLRLKEAILPDFLIHVLQSHSIRQQIQTRAKPAVNQASINQTDVRRFWIPLPKLEEQSAIAKILADQRALHEAVRRRLSLFVTLRDGLVQDLLTGRTGVLAKVEATGT